MNEITELLHSTLHLYTENRKFNTLAIEPVR